MTPLLVQKAMHMASWAHGYQRYNDKPYFMHCQEVAELAAELADHWRMDRGVAMAIGYLHDTLEDTDLTPAKISVEISPEVARVVEILTKKPDEDYFEDYLPRVGGDRMARLVKLADMRCNLGALPHVNRTAHQNRLWRKYIHGLEVLAQYMGVPNV